MVKRVFRFWQILWEMEEISILGDALEQRSLRERNNGPRKIKQELEKRLDMGYIRRNAKENNRSVWREVSKS